MKFTYQCSKLIAVSLVGPTLAKSKASGSNCLVKVEFESSGRFFGVVRQLIAKFDHTAIKGNPADLALQLGDLLTGAKIKWSCISIFHSKDQAISLKS